MALMSRSVAVSELREMRHHRRNRNVRHKRYIKDSQRRLSRRQESEQIREQLKLIQLECEVDHLQSTNLAQIFKACGRIRPLTQAEWEVYHATRSIVHDAISEAYRAEWYDETEELCYSMYDADFAGFSDEFDRDDYGPDDYDMLDLLDF